MEDLCKKEESGKTKEGERDHGRTGKREQGEEKAGQQWEDSPAELLLSLACHLRGHQGAPHTVVKETKQLIQRFLNSVKIITKHAATQMYTHSV